MSTNEQRIREFAYQIWESEGKPHGQSERHWQMACTLAKTQAESDLGTNDTIDNVQQMGSTEPIEPISPTQPAQPVPPSDPIQPTDPVQPAQPTQPASPTANAQFTESPAAKAAVTKSRAKSINAEQVIARVVTNEKAAARKKSAGKGELNTDVKFKTDVRKSDTKSAVEKTATDATKKATRPRKAKVLETN